MNLNGIIFRDLDCWLADIAGLDLMVQGENQDTAYENMQQVFEEEFPKVDATFSWLHREQGVFTVNFKKPGQILHEMIKRHREASEKSLTQIVKNCKGFDQNLWGSIESGETQSTAAQFFSMLNALDLDVIISVKKRVPLD